ncbi:hypothetical protein [uncultured Hymenobacter sp.]|uniref:hypothetical protein n=1 Tax=uncultured Hymenobacter sp. TaxID=170016 RepID=UPI0035CC18D2
MKTLLLLGLGCVLTTSATAQAQKGTRYLGASIGSFSYSHEYDRNSFSAALVPTGGLFLTNRLLLGSEVQLGYSLLRFRNRNSSALNYRRRVFSYGFAPVARYYFNSTGPHRFFGQLSAGVFWLNSRNNDSILGSYDGRSQTQNYAKAGITLGYNYFVTPGAALEVTAGYSHTSSLAAFNTGFLDVRAGFAVFLPSKQAATVPAQ